MRDLNHDSNGTSWPSLYCGENNLPIGQYYYSALPRPSPDLVLGVDKDLLKQKMLEHEAVFKDQVFELHRLYRVQKDLMDEVRKKEQYKHRTPYETSLSSTPLPSPITPKESHRQNSSCFLFTSSVCGGPPVSDPEFIGSSTGGFLKGKSVQGHPISLQNCASPKNSEVSETRPTKWRKMFDLQLPADEYVDTDEVEQCGNRMTYDSGEKSLPSHCEKTKYQELVSKSDSCLRKPNALADLNEPLESGETTANPSVNFSGVQNQDLLTKVPAPSGDVSCKPRHQNNYHYNDKGNGQNWFSSMLKTGGTKDNGKFIHHTNHSEKAPLPSPSLQASFENPHPPHGMFPPHHVKEDPWPAKANDSSNMFDKSRSLYSFNNPGGLTASHLPSYAFSSNYNSWDPSWGKPSNHLNQKSTSDQKIPFFSSASFSKSSQSSAQSNDFLGPWWQKNSNPRSNPGFGSDPPVQSGVYHGSSSGGCKELPARFSNAGLHYVNGSYNDKAASGSGNFSKGTHSLDLNSTRDLDMNVVLPNGLSSESLPRQGEAKREDPLSVLPWLREKASRSALDHQSSVTSTSCNVDATKGKDHVISDCPGSVKKILGVSISPTPGEQEIDSGKKKLLLDINLPCDDPEEFGIVAATREVISVEEKMEAGCPNDLRNMIDLNSCLTEDEIPSRTLLTNSSSTAKPERGIIDLEAPVDLEAEEEGNCVLDEELLMDHHQLPSRSSLQDSTDSSDENLARVAAEAILAISFSSPETCLDDTIRPQPAEETSDSDDALRRFADMVCSCPDDNTDSTSSESDYFEEMTLKLTECTVEEYLPNPPSFDILAVEETGATNVTGRPRRGPARRGRQRRDFQRDILPGLASLARHEVTEDLQTFGGLMRATGHAWHCGSRRNSSRNGSGRGRRKAVVVVPPPTPTPPPPLVKTIDFASQKQLLKNGEIIFEDRSLTSWGKTTRRPRRQRCAPAAGNPAPIPLS